MLGAKFDRGGKVLEMIQKALLNGSVALLPELAAQGKDYLAGKIEAVNSAADVCAAGGNTPADRKAFNFTK
jgi:hypothetical protein